MIEASCTGAPATCSRAEGASCTPPVYVNKQPRWESPNRLQHRRGSKQGGSEVAVGHRCNRLCQADEADSTVCSSQDAAETRGKLKPATHVKVRHILCEKHSKVRGCPQQSNCSVEASAAWITM